MSPFRGSVPLTQEWRHFRFESAGGIATVTLDRPDKLNALTFDSYADLRDLLAELPHRGDVRVLVLRGSGRAVCSGGGGRPRDHRRHACYGPGRTAGVHPDDRRGDPGHAGVLDPDRRRATGHGG